MHTDKLLDISLKLFDGAAAGGEGAGAAGADNAGSDAAGQGNSGETILYGKQPAQTPDAGEEKVGVQSTSNTLEDKQRAFRQLVEGEYKEQYTQDTQRIINARFRQTKALEKQVADTKPVMDLLLQRYGIEDGSMDKLLQAVENDNAYWSEAAEEAGMSVEQYKEVQRLKRENAAFMEAERKRETQKNADAKFAQWAKEAAEVQQLYPSFDLRQELENEQFRYLISNARAPVPLLHAYEVVHRDEVRAGIARMQAQATEKQVVDSIRARGARPAENGASSQSAFTVRDDVSKLSGKDIADINRRVMRGERISFG